MNGVVDEGGRALLDVRISNKLQGEYSAVTTWIDTAFDGHLVLSLGLIKVARTPVTGTFTSVRRNPAISQASRQICVVQITQ